MLNKDLRSGGLVERSRAAAANQLNDPVTRMRFLQGKGQVKGISLASLQRRGVLEGSRPMLPQKRGVQDLLFCSMEQQEDNWVDEMNTQDQAQKTRLTLSLGGNCNSEILDQNIKDATATPAKSARANIPPTPALTKRITKRNQRNQLQSCKIK